METVTTLNLLLINVALVPDAMAADKFDLAVCDAYENYQDQQKCRSELNSSTTSVDTQIASQSIEQPSMPSQPQLASASTSGMDPGNFNLVFFGVIAFVLLYWKLRRRKAQSRIASNSAISDSNVWGRSQSSIQQENVKRSRSARSRHNNQIGNFADSETVYMDIETTGLSPDTDEILEISIVNDEGDTLLDELVRPVHKTEWPQAQRVNKISPRDVKRARTFDQIKGDIKQAISGKRVVFYNARFDTGFLGPVMNVASDIQCAMLAWQDYVGSRDKLVNAASSVGFNWAQFDAHRSRGDAYATRAVWRHLIDEAASKPKLNSNTGKTAFHVEHVGAQRLHYTDSVDEIKQLKREGKHSEAIELLVRAIEFIEAEARFQGAAGGVAPWYYEQLAIIYRKEKRYADEVAILEQYEQQRKAPGASQEKLAERLLKARSLAAKKNSS